MKEDDFKRLVNKLPFRGTIIEIYYGMTPSNKRYAIIINHVWRFAIRLVFEDDRVFVSSTLPNKASEHLTLQSANEKRDKIINNLMTIDSSIQRKINTLLNVFRGLFIINSNLNKFI